MNTVREFAAFLSRAIDKSPGLTVTRISIIDQPSDDRARPAAILAASPLGNGTRFVVVITEDHDDEG